MHPVGRLPCDLGRQAGLAALVCHLRQLVRDGPQLLRRLLLLRSSLLTAPASGLAEQVPGLLSGLDHHHLGLLGGGLGNMAARLAGGPADIRGLISRDVRRGRLRLRS